MLDFPRGKNEGTCRSEEGPLCDRESELLLGGNARVVRGDNKWDGGKKCCKGLD